MIPVLLHGQNWALASKGTPETTKDVSDQYILILLIDATLHRCQQIGWIAQYGHSIFAQHYGYVYIHDLFHKYHYTVPVAIEAVAHVNGGTKRCPQ